jgi:hypothetical protein
MDGRSSSGVTVFDQPLPERVIVASVSLAWMLPGFCTVTVGRDLPLSSFATPECIFVGTSLTEMM